MKKKVIYCGKTACGRLIADLERDTESLFAELRTVAKEIDENCGKYYNNSLKPELMIKVIQKISQTVWE